MLTRLRNPARQSKKGFTVIELIIVMAILGILLGVMIVPLSGYLDIARKTSVKAEAKTVLTGVQAYVTSEVVLNNAVMKESDVTIENVSRANYLNENALKGGTLEKVEIDSDSSAVTHLEWQNDGYKAIYSAEQSPQWQVE